MEESIEDGVNMMNWVSAKLTLVGVDGIEYVVEGRTNDFTIEVQTEPSAYIEFGDSFKHYRQASAARPAKMDVSIMIENIESLFRACDAFSAAGNNKVEEMKDRLFRKLNI